MTGRRIGGMLPASHPQSKATAADAKKEAAKAALPARIVAQNADRKTLKPLR
jgi:hypothetical protein